ncbi:hypothetical protein PGT21_027830 [Puccinia graminis f. sp. tritici]|uniref:Uncharacterized protein n=1 Tax=Puccinia graminis f. sp. tritici TaxID=56615 RepID=A0A5B0QP00_PUCGR|nr:hypothetical protein PGT21_027830 [Puccinia graminis f. sp. tritici]
MLLCPGPLALHGVLWILIISETPAYICSSATRLWKRAEMAELKLVPLSRIPKTEGSLEEAHGSLEAVHDATSPQGVEKSTWSLINPHAPHKDGSTLGSPIGSAKQPLLGQGGDTPDNQDQKKNLSGVTETEEIAKKVRLKGLYVDAAAGIAGASIEASNPGALRTDVNVESIPIACFFGSAVIPSNPKIKSATITETLAEDGLGKFNNNLVTDVGHIKGGDHSSSLGHETSKILAKDDLK